MDGVCGGLGVSEPFLDTVLPAGGTWSRVCRRGTALTLVDIDGGANVSALFYCAADPLERYCMPDTLKAQHVSRLTAGIALHSDMGRVLASVLEDTCGWHDTITGHATGVIADARWGESSFQEHGNDWRRSARDGLLVELAKHGLDRRDLTANVNFFTKVAVDPEGVLEFAEGHAAPGMRVTLRFDLGCLAMLSNVPHPLNPTPDWTANRVRLELSSVSEAAADDQVRRACAENERAFAATETSLR